MSELKQRVIRGGFAKFCSQITTFVVRMGSLMILARLLDPKDFGLVGMVTAVTGVFSVFRDFGLSAAAIQRTSISEQQASTLFWINLLVGALLTILVATTAPFVARFYHEPKLLGITIALASGFLFNAAGVQQSATLERQLRFTVLSAIDILSWVTSAGVGIMMAIHGFRYWSLVATATVTPLVFTVCAWLATGWVPGRPHRGVGVRSMARFGGTLTLNGLVMYATVNFDKILLGKFWGAEALGIYGRAYQLINIPNDNLNSSVGGVAFAALSRLKEEPARFRSYFLKGYTTVLSLTVPIAAACALFAGDMIPIFLGSKWNSAVPVFRLLAPTVLAFSIINPLGWLLVSLGLVGRGLKMALGLAPFLIGGYAIGLPHGPKGVALAYSVMMTICVIPMIASAVHNTVVSVKDILLTVSRPLLSGIVAAGLVFGLERSYSHILPPLARLALGLSLLGFFYLAMLLYVMRQKQLYVDIVRGFIGRSPAKEEVPASA